MGRPRRRAGPVRPAAEHGRRRRRSDLGRRRLQPSHSGLRHRRAAASSCGARTASEPGQLAYPYGLVLDGQGHVYVCEFGNHRVQKFTLDGKSLGCWGTHGREPGELHNPWAVVRDSRGRIHVLDSSNHRVQRIRDVDRRPSPTDPAIDSMLQHRLRQPLVPAAAGRCCRWCGGSAFAAWRAWAGCAARWRSALRSVVFAAAGAGAGRNAVGAHERPADGDLSARSVAEHLASSRPTR